MGVTNKIYIKDMGWNKLLKEHAHLNNVKTKIGLFGNGQPGQNVAYRGAILHFGVDIKVTDKMRNFLRMIGLFLKNTTKHIRIPKRPFMAYAVDRNKPEIMDFIKNQYILLLKGVINTRIFLNRIGIKHSDQIKMMIRGGNYKKLHPVTKQQKGSSKPLIDTGEMINKVIFKHKKGDVK